MTYKGISQVPVNGGEGKEEKDQFSQSKEKKNNFLNTCIVYRTDSFFFDDPGEITVKW